MGNERKEETEKKGKRACPEKKFLQRISRDFNADRSFLISFLRMEFVSPLGNGSEK